MTYHVALFMEYSNIAEVRLTVHQNYIEKNIESRITCSRCRCKIPMLDIYGVPGSGLNWLESVLYCCPSSDSRWDLIIRRGYPERRRWAEDVRHCRSGSDTGSRQYPMPLILFDQLGSVALGHKRLRENWRTGNHDCTCSCY